jgi:putative transposase
MEDGLLPSALCLIVLRRVSADNRKTQEKFTCIQCGFTAQADFVAAVNIKEAGLALLACTQSSAEVRPSWLEPTEGIRAYA